MFVQTVFDVQEDKGVFVATQLLLNLLCFVIPQAVYRHDYVHNIKGKYTPVDKTVDLNRANYAHKIQCEVSARTMPLNAVGRIGERRTEEKLHWHWWHDAMEREH